MQRFQARAQVGVAICMFGVMLLPLLAEANQAGSSQSDGTLSVDSTRLDGAHFGIELLAVRHGAPAPTNWQRPDGRSGVEISIVEDRTGDSEISLRSNDLRRSSRLRDGAVTHFLLRALGRDGNAKIPESWDIDLDLDKCFILGAEFRPVEASIAGGGMESYTLLSVDFAKRTDVEFLLKLKTGRWDTVCRIDAGMPPPVRLKLSPWHGTGTEVRLEGVHPELHRMDGHIFGVWDDAERECTWFSANTVRGRAWCAAHFRRGAPEGFRSLIVKEPEEDVFQFRLRHPENGRQSADIRLVESDEPSRR